MDIGFLRDVAIQGKRLKDFTDGQINALAGKVKVEIAGEIERAFFETQPVEGELLTEDGRSLRFRRDEPTCFAQS